jgi:FAD/FMN-containing dehydrogenase
MDMTNLNRVVEELLRHRLQFYVNVELGNLTVGSAACGGTKDASMPGEFGQVSSYVIGMKVVTPSGELLEVTEEQPELLQVMRSSYGLLGIVCEVTFRAKPLRPMAVRHETYSVDEFDRELPELRETGESLMLYLFPFQNEVTVEFRREGRDDGSPNRLLWGARNFVWKTVGPAFASLVTEVVPLKGPRYFLVDRFNELTQIILNRTLQDRNTIPSDQIIRYPEQGGLSAYTFSLWAFPEESYGRILRAYFMFCQEYYRQQGYRCNMLNVGYRISRDTSSLFSYSSRGTVITLDPVSTGDPGWDGFLVAYNDFCSANDGVPLFNQTKGITPQQARRAFGSQLDTFREYRTRFDPKDRLLNQYFKALLESPINYQT